jgi:diguanylate cyclase (GGDEF)-like protein
MEGMASTLGKLGKPASLILGILVVGLIGYVDYVTGIEIGFSPFYLIPIVFVTWFVNARSGFVLAVLAAVTWGVADRLGGAHYSNEFIPYWNAAIRLTFFLITILSLKYRKALEVERNFSRTDYVTGALNPRFFHAVAQREIDWSKRHQKAFTAAYIDVDNFKAINDQYGHALGDEVLRTAAKTLQSSLRKTDLVARLGGDEFVIVLPEVGADGLQSVISKLHKTLTDEMSNHGWPATFSIGAVAFTATPRSTDDIIRLTDRLMYAAKQSGKNAVIYGEYGGEPAELRRVEVSPQRI